MELLFALRKAGEIDEPLRLVGEAVAVNRRILGDTGMPTLHARALQVVLLRAAGTRRAPERWYRTSRRTSRAHSATARSRDAAQVALPAAR